jgi:hypothetical protein
MVVDRLEARALLAEPVDDPKTVECRAREAVEVGHDRMWPASSSSSTCPIRYSPRSSATARAMHAQLTELDDNAGSGAASLRRSRTHRVGRIACPPAPFRLRYQMV